MLLDERSPEAEEIIQLKKENVRLRLSFQNLNKAILSKEQQINQLTQRIKELQGSNLLLNDKLRSIEGLLGVQKEKDPVCSLTEIEIKLKTFLKQIPSLNSSQKSQSLEKIQQLEQALRKREEEKRTSQAMLGDYANRLSSLEIQLRESKVNRKSEEAKKQCYDLMNSICVKDDDYLRSYLLRNNKYQNGITYSTRKNKHDFIFHD